MSTTTITVSLDINADPPVTVNTPDLVITSTGNQTIQWVPGGSTAFTFTSLTVLTTPNPITIDPVTDTLITATDDNETSGTYTYRISVLSNGIPYSTDYAGPAAGDPGDPHLENDPPEK